MSQLFLSHFKSKYFKSLSTNPMLGLYSLCILMNFSFSSGWHLPIVYLLSCCSFVYYNVELLSSINLQVYFYYIGYCHQIVRVKSFYFWKLYYTMLEGCLLHVHSVVSACHPLVSYICFFLFSVISHTIPTPYSLICCLNISIIDSIL